jgi:hypothetical protein
MTKTYRAEFFTSADWAFRDFEAETPEQALAVARQFYADNLGELNFQSYDAIEPLDHMQIWDAKRGSVASWESDEYRLRLAAPDLLKALADQTDAAQAVIDNWSKGDLAGAVRALDASIETARTALAKAKGGQS